MTHPSAALRRVTKTARHLNTWTRWLIAAGLCCSSVHAVERPFAQPDVLFDYDVKVTMSDGLPLAVNVFRPKASGRYPVVITHGIYGKDILWQSAPPYRAAWQKMTQKLPDLCKRSTCQFMRWEMPDPERWVPAGYAVIHADSRGAGKTPGVLDPLGPRETMDFKELIEWAARQPWSNGKVGLLGISYYAINQWQVAALQPQGLAAIIPWEGAVDHYRDISHHGGIPSTLFTKLWYEQQVRPVQHGNGQSEFKDVVTGGAAVGATLSPALLLGNGDDDPMSTLLAHALDDATYQQKTPRLERIQVPVLSVGNWGGVGLHLRGNIEGFVGVKSPAWLRIHSGDHFSPFYEERALALQMKFFERYLKGSKNGWEEEPRIELLVRHPLQGFVKRAESAWPLVGTRFTNYYLAGTQRSLQTELPRDPVETHYEAAAEGITFTMAAADQDLEFTGPAKAKLWVRPSSKDMDLFLTLRLLDPAGKDVKLEGANAPAVAVTHGWLRLSHRELNPEASQPSRPYYYHRQTLPVEPGQDYAVEVEIWPTSIVVPKGHRLALTVQGRDFTFPDLTTGLFRGTAPFLHDGRDPDIFGGTQTLLTGGNFDSHIVLPLIPAERQTR